MEPRGSLLRRVLPGKLIDEIRDLLFRLRLGGSLGLANAKTAQAAIGDVDPEWRRRIDDVVSCPDKLLRHAEPVRGLLADRLRRLRHSAAHTAPADATPHLQWRIA